jgi:hypothetical protein
LREGLNFISLFTNFAHPTHPDTDYTDGKGGGDDSPVNVVTACLPCNNRKRDRTPAEARMPLLTSQTALRVKLERVVLCHYAEARAEWRKYLFMDMHDDRDVMDRVSRERQAQNHR